MFVVRYDDDKRAHLANHTDDGSISINVLLNDEFEGGGTRLWNRDTKEAFAHVNPSQVGNVLLHSATLNHEGVHVTKGTRTIFVGFLSVDRVDPWSFENGGTSYRMTGLSWWASWGSLNWCAIKFKEGVTAADIRLDVLHQHSWRNHPYVRSLFSDMFYVLTAIGDYFVPHRSIHLVANQDREAYLETLDAMYEDKESKRKMMREYEEATGVTLDYQANGLGQSEWFLGQQINVDITGDKSSSWKSREDYSHRFMASELN